MGTTFIRVLTLTLASILLGACNASNEKTEIVPPIKSPPAPQTHSEIDEYKTLLWVHSQIDNGLDCRDPKAGLAELNLTDPKREALMRDYDYCFVTGLYYHSFRLPFLKVSKKNTLEMRRIIFFDLLEIYEKKYPEVKAEQARLGFPEPPQIPWDGELSLSGEQ